ncbi:MAG: adenylate/guanylate cyclase domain-containing protein [Acidobacteriota bacterium]|nr:adenylate/guanylate cyclase domain-containing protein [Blastocatellia bacterium]MDW8412982.1 adenylate/guanylate cyclase domain-containing protein [Acidobacteriota bacterium]
MGKSELILEELISKRLCPGANIDAIDHKIWTLFGETWAVLCSDMSGFTIRTERFGIIHFLTLIYEMRRIAKPLILEHSGLLLKAEADNLLVLFRDLNQALLYARDIHKTIAKYNETKNVDYQLAVSIGIGYGRILKIGDTDCYGNEVNRAFKLGEDIAQPHETLLTPSAYELASNLPNFSFRKIISHNRFLPEYYVLEE